MYIILAVWPEAELGTPCLLEVKHYMWPSPQSIKNFNSESLCLAFADPNESEECRSNEERNILPDCYNYWNFKKKQQVLLNMNPT